MGKYASIREFMETNYLHFNSAAMVVAATVYEAPLTYRWKNDDHTCRSNVDS